MQDAMLVTRVGGTLCALPIEHVVETMRPLPVVSLGTSELPALALIEGMAMIRGAPVPVVDVRRLLGVTGERATRFVVVRSGTRRIALLVDAVLEVRRIELDAMSRLPPLLAGASRDSVSAIGARDAGLLVVLDAGRVLPEDAWPRIEPGGEQGGER